MLTTLHASATTIVDKIRETRRELDMIKRGVHAPSWKDVPGEMLNRAFSQAMYYTTRKYDNRGKWHSIPELIELIAAEPHPSVSWLSEVRAPGPDRKGTLSRIRRAAVRSAVVLCRIRPSSYRNSVSVSSGMILPSRRIPFAFSRLTESVLAVLAGVHSGAGGGWLG